jgi:hypothetical protein
MISSHPSIELRREHKVGLCSPGSALLVASHLALCSQCLATQFSPAWPMPNNLVADHDRGGEINADALRGSSGAGWRGVDSGARITAIKGVSGVGEAVYSIEAASGAPMTLPDASMFLLVLQGVLTDGCVFFARGDFVDLTDADLLNAAGAGAHGCLCLMVSETNLTL